VVDNAFVDLTGHNFEYCRSVCWAARSRGLDAEVLVHRQASPDVLRGLPARPVFRHLAYQRFCAWPALRPILDPILANLGFLWDLSRAMRGCRTPGDLVFLPNATYRQTFAVAAWLATSRRPRRVVTLFRYTLRRHEEGGGWQPAARLARASFRMLEAVSRRHELRLVSDSQRLAEEYAQLTCLPVHVVPIPHAASRGGVVAPPPTLAQDRPARFVMLGEARDDKGFPLLVEALERLRGPLSRGDLAVTVQCHLRDGAQSASHAARARLEAAGLPGVRLLTEPVDTATYHALLTESHAVLIPYRRGHYRSQTSGILTEALAAARPVVVTSGTWMADQTRAYGAGVCFEEGDPDDLARAILAVAEDLPSLGARALAAREDWLTRHTPEKLLEALLGEVGS